VEKSKAEDAARLTRPSFGDLVSDDVRGKTGALVEDDASKIRATCVSKIRASWVFTVLTATAARAGTSGSIRAMIAFELSIMLATVSAGEIPTWSFLGPLRPAHQEGGDGKARDNNLEGSREVHGGNKIC
jgi:hypothetical protein